MRRRNIPLIAPVKVAGEAAGRMTRHAPLHSDELQIDAGSASRVQRGVLAELT